MSITAACCSTSVKTLQQCNTMCRSDPSITSPTWRTGVQFCVTIRNATATFLQIENNSGRKSVLKATNIHVCGMLSRKNNILLKSHKICCHLACMFHFFHVSLLAKEHIAAPNARLTHIMIRYFQQTEEMK